MTRTNRFFALIVMLAAVVSLTIATPVTSMAASNITKVEVTETVDYARASQVLTLINRHRAKAGLKALTMDQTLVNNAVTRASECSLYYSHTRANGKKWNTALTKSYRKAAENIAYGFADAQSVVNAWMNSAGHKANIMNPSYTCIGIGCVDVNGYTFWVQCFTDGTARKCTSNGRVTKNASVDVLSNRVSVNKSVETVRMKKGVVVFGTMFLKNAGRNGLSVAVAKNNVAYASSNTKVVKVDANGKIMALGKGTANVTLKLKGNTSKVKTYKVTVVQ